MRAVGLGGRLAAALQGGVLLAGVTAQAARPKTSRLVRARPDSDTGRKRTNDPRAVVGPLAWLAFSAVVRAEPLAREPAAQGHPEPVDMHADDGTFDCAARNSCSALGAYMAANAPPAVVTLRG